MVFKQGGRNCAVLQCNNYVRKTSVLEGQEKITYHRIPRESSLYYHEWISRIRAAIKPSKWARICSQHFAEEDFIYLSGKRPIRVLKKSAVPSLNLHEEFIDTFASPLRSPTPKRTENGVGLIMKAYHVYSPEIGIPWNSKGSTSPDHVTYDNIASPADNILLDEFGDFISKVPRMKTKNDTGKQISLLFDMDQYAVSHPALVKIEPGLTSGRDTEPGLTFGRDTEVLDSANTKPKHGLIVIKDEPLLSSLNYSEVAFSYTSVAAESPGLLQYITYDTSPSSFDNQPGFLDASASRKLEQEQDPLKLVESEPLHVAIKIEPVDVKEEDCEDVVPHSEYVDVRRGWSE